MSKSVYIEEKIIKLSQIIISHQPKVSQRSYTNDSNPNLQLQQHFNSLIKSEC